MTSAVYFYVQSFGQVFFFFLLVTKLNEMHPCPIFVVHKLLCPFFRVLSQQISLQWLILSLSLAHSFLHQSIRRKDDPQEVRVQIQFLTYGTRPSKDKSGAYLFLPDGNAKVVSGSLDWGEKQFIKQRGVN